MANGIGIDTQITGPNALEIDEEHLLSNFVSTVYIGLGGSGKDVLLRLRKHFLDKYGGKSFDFARFLVIDTDTGADEVPLEGKPDEYQGTAFDPDEKVKCKISKHDFDTTFQEVKGNVPSLCTGWLMPTLEAYGHNSVEEGAGTHREFGRMAFMLNYRDIRKAIETHIREALKFAGNHTEPVLGTSVSVEPNRVEVVLLTSLAGGTGSGILIDTAYLVRDILGDASGYITVIAMLPNLFRDQEEEKLSRMKQNTYAALLELEHYGTPRTEEGMLVGQSSDWQSLGIRVEFFAPWKDIMPDDEEPRIIKDPGWDACYLVDDHNVLTEHNPLTRAQTFRMVADYLFYDFQPSEFSIRKRSARPNLVQFQERAKETRIRKTDKSAKTHSGLVSGADVVFATQNGCTFSSFGLAEITFDLPRIYRAAGYRLAERLVKGRWLCAAPKVDSTDYEKWAKEDVTDPSPLGEETLLDSLYEYNAGDRTGNRLKEMEAHLSEERNLPEGSSTRLHKLHERNHALFGEKGEATKNLHVRARALRGSNEESDLGRCRTRVRNLARRRCDEYGVPITQELLDYYRVELDSGKDANSKDDSVVKRVKQWLVTSGSSPAKILGRVDEAEQLGFRVNRIAMPIEYPNACDKLKAYWKSEYRRAAAKDIQEIAVGCRQYIGSGAETPPDGLARHGTLHRHYQKAESFLKELKTHLHLCFSRSRSDTGDDRKQSLLPDWDENDYDRLTDAVLLTDGNVGPRDSKAIDSLPFNSQELEKRIIEDVMQEYATQQGKDVGPNTFSNLIDFWINSPVRTETVKKIAADLIAAACAKLLDGKIDLGRFADGNVVNVLASFPDTIREAKLEKLVKQSAPYFFCDAGAVGGVTFQPVYRNVLAMDHGDDAFTKNNAATTEADMKLNSASDGNTTSGLAGNIHETPVGTKSSLVYCREVCGVPLQSYKELTELFNAYHEEVPGPVKAVDQCHIDFRESADYLPDIREIKVETYIEIRDHVEDVLFAIITGDITCRDDGFAINVIGESSRPIPYHLGTRLSRVIKHACEKKSICKQLNERREYWNQKGEHDPKVWAAILASIERSVDELQPAVRAGGTNAPSPPLLNCLNHLRLSVEKPLQNTSKGKEWLKRLLPRHLDPDLSDEARDRLLKERTQLYDCLTAENGVLHRLRKNIPLYRISKNLDQMQLPEEDTGQITNSVTPQ